MLSCSIWLVRITQADGQLIDTTTTARGEVGRASHTAPSAPHTRPTQRLSRPPTIQKLGAENHMLQLNI